MDANQYVFVHGMRQTRSILERWGEDPWPVHPHLAAGRGPDRARPAGGGDGGGVAADARLRLSLRPDGAGRPEPGPRARRPGAKLPGPGPARLRLRRRLHRRRDPAAHRRAPHGSLAADPREGPPDRLRLGDRRDLLLALHPDPRSRPGRLDDRLGRAHLGAAARAHSPPPRPARADRRLPAARGLDHRQPQGRVGPAARRDGGHRGDRDPDAAGRGDLGGLRLAQHPPRRLSRQHVV